jgi:glycosyltransferase involved in cell wall biosynthesis
MVVPLRIGGGSRLKILEAASSGLPVISTSVGAEGLAIEAGRHFIKAESAAEFADAVINFADNPAEHNDLAQAARRLVQQRYGWAHLAQTMDAVWRSAACAKPYSGKK